jgi:hypothetical protein
MLSKTSASSQLAQVMTPLYAQPRPTHHLAHYLQVAEYIAECARILEKSGLKYQVRSTSPVLLTDVDATWSDAVRSRHFHVPMTSSDIS